ncbi:MAG: hypothetical protein Q4G51_10985 [Dermatophilus congolensis]|nr:hypothetical protein [Dermatophilus congolensis]
MAARASGRLLGEHMPSLSDHTFSDQAVLVVAFDRVFDAPVEDVWPWLVEPELTAQWYGPGLHVGDRGEVKLPMHAGVGAPAMNGTLVECDPGRFLRLQFREGKYTWYASATLDRDHSTPGAPTTLTCVQSFGSAEFLERIGPSWDYFLDKLVLAQAGDDPHALTFTPDYFPALVPYYQGLIREAIAAAQRTRDNADAFGSRDVGGDDLPR